MRVLLVSTLKRKVDKDETASRSQIIYRLAKGLLKKGHKVSLLGTSDSKIDGVETIGVIDKGWVDMPPVENPFFRDTASLVKLSQKLKEVQNSFDIIHNHTYPEFFPLVLENEITKPLVTTIHSQATDYIDETLSKFKKTRFVALSKAHKNEFKKAKIDFVVYNGIDTSKFSYSDQKREYLLWIGRLSKARDKAGNFMDPKGVRWAIELAKKTGFSLKLTGNVEDIEFYEREIKPNLSDKIQWVGKVSQEQSLSSDEIIRLMQKAKVFLMTVNWEEPFGLVMAEAQSTGTPVIGFDRGAVSELVKDGKTGFVVSWEKGIKGLQEALSNINRISGKDCRDWVLENFSQDSMVSEYEKVYRKVLAR